MWNDGVTKNLIRVGSIDVYLTNFTGAIINGDERGVGREFGQHKRLDTMKGTKMNEHEQINSGSSRDSFRKDVDHYDFCYCGVHLCARPQLNIWQKILIQRASTGKQAGV